MRRAAIALAFAVAGFAPTTEAQQIDETFDTVVAPALPTGWIVRNQSTTIGTNTNCWNNFASSTVIPPHSVTNEMLANFGCTTGANTISGWLLTPNLTNLQNGNQVTFWTRKAAPDNFPDRMEVRLCLAAANGCGAAGSTGATSTDVGLFATLLTSINPTLITGVYPTTFTQFSVTLSGLPAGPNEGRIAFRYFVTSGGPTGANSDIIALDDVFVTDTLPVELMTFEVE